MVSLWCTWCDAQVWYVYGMACHGMDGIVWMVWYGIVWCGMVLWCSVVWYVMDGMVWYDNGMVW